MKKVSVLCLLLIVFFSAAAQQKVNPNARTLHRVVVKEVLQTTNYTYLFVKEDTAGYWLAVPKTDISAGDTCYHLGGVEMRNFQSKEMNRNFPSLWFMDLVSKSPEGMRMMGDVPEHGKKRMVLQKDIEFHPVEGCLPLNELFRKRKDYEGKKVRINGTVVKYNEKIMGKNWAHIQDGSSFGDLYDLPVTLPAALKEGEKVTLEGKIALNKDFGSGYSFPVLMEDAVIVK